MLLVIKKKATLKQIKKMAEDFAGYIKVVVDVEKGILAGGGERQFEAGARLASSYPIWKNLHSQFWPD